MSGKPAGYDKRHLAAGTDGQSRYRAMCQEILTKWVTPVPVLDRSLVNCPACLKYMSEHPVSGGFVEGPVHFIHRGVAWHQESSAPYRCGAMGDQASTAMRDVTCTDCLERLGVGGSTPLQKPPVMNDHDDGIFTFYDVDYFAEGQLRNRSTLEVVPQTTGNVEITLTSMGNDDMLFTLSHLDRANLLRALLHDFHYSPERGGPDDQD